MLQLIVLQVKRGSREEDEDAIAGYREKGKKGGWEKEPVKVRRRGTGRERETSLNACVISVFTSCNYGNLSAASQGQL